ncbi:2OG-Fe(II) oxygenase [Paenibacillus radicis (ex Xue et al. 2023)]|uniref:2OG-Fe(II) oxygenase n=1 Tax=Paenibacillus radicis (ex Xue et al. 2023) TaxID=2972489 RepID=A0ABT1YSR7_9BACL|nr:2OG-Fe(II) oxygenase [Paenibacillus radicis (ex Xue et al. 2023)]MCR8636220.1 2OG-Fe(II) oxygenase [Paenibacillus radicis (ex Xue et al. 2023)]
MIGNTTEKERTIFDHAGNTITTEDREIRILAKYEAPLIVVLGDVLSNEECDELIRHSRQQLQRSKIGEDHAVNQIRTSSGVFCEENETITRIEKRLSQIMNIPVEHSDGLQVLLYTPGQEYRPHYDFFTETSRASANNRISTLVMYLNDVEEGGETAFPMLNFSIVPNKGMAVYFEYFYNNHELNDFTLHAGTPVIKGEKWVATMWMRRQAVRFS